MGEWQVKSIILVALALPVATVFAKDFATLPLEHSQFPPISKEKAIDLANRFKLFATLDNSEPIALSDLFDKPYPSHGPVLSNNRHPFKRILNALWLLAEMATQNPEIGNSDLLKKNFVDHQIYSNYQSYLEAQIEQEKIKGIRIVPYLEKAGAVFNRDTKFVDIEEKSLNLPWVAASMLVHETRHSEGLSHTVACADAQCTLLYGSCKDTDFACGSSFPVEMEFAARLLYGQTNTGPLGKLFAWWLLDVDNDRLQTPVDLERDKLEMHGRLNVHEVLTTLLKSEITDAPLIYDLSKALNDIFDPKEIFQALIDPGVFGESLLTIAARNNHLVPGYQNNAQSPVCFKDSSIALLSAVSSALDDDPPTIAQLTFDPGSSGKQPVLPLLRESVMFEEYAMGNTNSNSRLPKVIKGDVNGRAKDPLDLAAVVIDTYAELVPEKSAPYLSEIVAATRAAIRTENISFYINSSVTSVVMNVSQSGCCAFSIHLTPEIYQRLKNNPKLACNLFAQKVLHEYDFLYR